ncbi:MAG: DUF2281 domain-containing protein [Candidatus Cloacimonetes bacterium]|nr:DUF2281 domain-containing protein [Candidatus Cloacimonadota bacterium]MBL7086560.1 DUF2281 domain-containing protein [Candidatus Cloacimonadota bacterium]
MTYLTILMKALPYKAQKELIDFAEFLKARYYNKKKTQKLKFDWAGGLEKYKDKFEPVELQHKISEWWGINNVSR